VAQKQTFDGEKGKSVNMQTGSKDLEGEELEAMKTQALMFPELSYSERGVKTELVGVESVDDQDCYVMEITGKDGSVSSAYFNVDSGLKVQVMSTSEVPEVGEVSQTIKFGDYKLVKKVKFPFTQVIEGPQTVTMTSTTIDVNAKVDDSVFQ